MKTDDAIVIRTYATQQAADAAGLALESSGIEASFATDNAGGSCPFLNLVNGVAVLVGKSQEAEARSVLEKMDAEAAAGSERGHAPEKSKKFSVFMFGMVMGLGVASLGWWTSIHGNDEATVPVYDTAGKIQQLYHYQGGELSKLEEDRNGDGEMDKWSTYRTGESFDILLDNNFDGAVDGWCAYSDDNTGIEDFDQNFDGKSDSKIVYEYGMPKWIVDDNDFNGVFDSLWTHTNGVVLLVEVKPNGTNVVFTREEFRDGILKEEWVDEDMDGTFDTKTLFDPMGREVAVTKLNSQTRD